MRGDLAAKPAKLQQLASLFSQERLGKLIRDLRWTLLIVPGLVFVLVFFVYPLLSLARMSIYEGGFTAEHYRRLVEVPAYRGVLWNTIETSVIVTVLCVLLGYPVAYRLVTVGTRARILLLIGVMVPFWTSALVRTYGWMVILYPKGLINSGLQGANLIDSPLELIHNTTGVIIGMTQVMLPLMILPILAVMAGIDRTLVPAARSLGASPWRAFALVFLPLSLPGVYAGVLLVFIICLGFFIVPALLGGTSDLLIAQLIQFSINNVLNWGFAAALSTVLLVVTLTIYLVAGRWLNLDTLWGSGK